MKSLSVIRSAIRMNESTISKTFSPAGQWTLSFSLQYSDSDRKQQLLRTIESGKTTVRVFLEDAVLAVVFSPYEKDSPIRLSADLQAGRHEIKLVWRGYRAELWADGALLDEEWPIGTCFRTQEASVQTLSSLVQNVSYLPDVPAETEVTSQLHGAQYWAPKQGLVNVGDCMPFSDGDRFHLYYLKDRNCHQSKWGLGAHQFAHISSEDLVNWTVHPLAVPITHQWEGSICTGSIIKANGLYYAFYAVRMSDGTSARISWATSEDSIHFTKSETYFTLHEPYESTSVRDPEVFLGEDNRYHMLVTTSWLEAPAGRDGCLAHLVSDDLQNWEELPPFLIPGYTDQPECSNYFCWNGWYYLIFGNYGLAKYRYSRNPFGPWEKPEQETLGSYCYRVPKTAVYQNNRRIVAGFHSNAMDGGSYAGNVIFTELVQHADGTLGTKFVPEMDPIGNTVQASAVTKEDHFQPYQHQPLTTCQKPLALEVSMAAQNSQTSYGLTLDFDSGVSYEVRIEPFGRKLTVSTLHANPFLEDARRTLYQIEGLDKPSRLQLCFRHNLLHLCINDSRTLACRLPDTEDARSCDIGCFSKDGFCSFELHA